MHQGRQVATVGGVLLYGRNRLDRFPDAWIQAGRFDGLDKSRIADQVDLTMPLTDAIPAAIAFVGRHTARGTEIGPVRHRIRRALPPVADQAILEVLSDGDRKTREIADAIGRSTRATRTRLARLIDQGHVAVIGKGPQDPKRVYRKV